MVKDFRVTERAGIKIPCLLSRIPSVNVGFVLGVLVRGLSPSSHVLLVTLP
jgi:hypothetical protein